MNEGFELSHWKLHRTPGNILFVAKEQLLAERNLPLALAKYALTLSPEKRIRFRAKVQSHPEISEWDKKRFVNYLTRQPSRSLRPMHSAKVKKLARKLAKDPSARGLTAAERKEKERWLKEIRHRVR
jgi:hypothetical protein